MVLLFLPALCTQTSCFRLELNVLLQPTCDKLWKDKSQDAQVLWMDFSNNGCDDCHGSLYHSMSLLPQERSTPRTTSTLADMFLCIFWLLFSSKSSIPPSFNLSRILQNFLPPNDRPACFPYCYRWIDFSRSLFLFLSPPLFSYP